MFPNYCLLLLFSIGIYSDGVLLKVVKDSDPKSMLEAIREAIAKKYVLIIVGECSVDYIGRGESKLTMGDRMVVVKEDGALLIHRPYGYSPVNWQPSTIVIEVKEHDGRIVLTAVRDKPRETLLIAFNKIYIVVYGKLSDHGEFVMYMDEHDMRDILFEHPELIEDGLRIIEKEKDIGIGSIDLFGVDAENRPVIIELKRTSAGREAVHQLYGYVKAYKDKTGVLPRGILVAPSLTSSAIEALNKLKLEWREIDLRKLWKYRKERRASHESLFKYFKKEGEE